MVGECEIGSYGVDCSETCGHCLDVRQCSNSNGRCRNGCDAGYQGAVCKIREYMCFICCKSNMIRYENVLRSSSHKQFSYINKNTIAYLFVNIIVFCSTTLVDKIICFSTFVLFNFYFYFLMKWDRIKQDQAYFQDRKQDIWYKIEYYCFMNIFDSSTVNYILIAN